jgi:serine/threonine-protein kinase HipA
MNKILNVYLYSNLVGELQQDESGMVFFWYNADWLNHNNAIPISQSMPLRSEPFKRKELRGFFAGILPEEENRRVIAKNLGISASNDFAMLERIGGECAGAVTFVPAGHTLSEYNDNYILLSDEALANIIKDLPKRPLMAGERGVRLSLAGAQDKIVVAIRDNKIMLPLDGSPSTHIIKPAIDQYENIVHNEQFCLTLADAIGLPTANSYALTIGAVECLVIERYDRRINKTGGLIRIHQEDFCQALGIVPEMKYQAEGGPSLKQCFDFIRRSSTIPVIDIGHLLDAVIYNYFIGNNDAHAKNFSILYNIGSDKPEVRLAPLYDLISTASYPELSSNMAMKIGDTYNSNEVSVQDWDKFAISSGLAAPIVHRQITVIAKRILKYLKTYPDREKLMTTIDHIEARCRKFL